MKSLNSVCAVDVSKDTLDLYYNNEEGKEIYWRINNDSKGHALMLQKLGCGRTYVMECSGPYYLRLAFLLKTAGADVRAENPITVKRFMQMNGERNKSDRKDARWLYRYGVEREAVELKVPSNEQLHCTQIMGTIELYTRQLTMASNQLHALEQLPVICKDVLKSLQKNTATVDQRNKTLRSLVANYFGTVAGRAAKKHRVYSGPWQAGRGVTDCLYRWLQKDYKLPATHCAGRPCASGTFQR